MGPAGGNRRRDAAGHDVGGFAAIAELERGELRRANEIPRRVYFARELDPGLPR